jgi:putative ABC transport system permease protein
VRITVSHTLMLAWQAINANKLRALLTSLGIIFGVGSVISMLSVGRGAEQEVLEQMKLLGANNIIVKPLVEQAEGKVEEDETKKSEKKRFSPGLTLADAQSIMAAIPQVEEISPELIQELTIVRNGLKRTSKVIGVDRPYFHLSDFKIAKGEMFTPLQVERAAPVCVIGNGVRAKFFAREDAIGKQIKCGNVWLTVVGVLEERKITDENLKHLGIRNYNMDIYTPITTGLLKFRNRALITKAMINKASSQQNGNGEMVSADIDDEKLKELKNYHQLDKLTIRVASSEQIAAISEIVTRMLERRHNRVVDFEVVIPELLLQQEQRTKTIFNIVLGAIASISLLVGGIGIMNIMLASVLERTREIGIRRAIGATRNNIIYQFLGEAVALCLAGGIVGIIFGFSLSLIIEKFTDIQTIVTPVSVIISFGVSVCVGLIFGIFPARRAALLDPIEALRYE